MVLLDGMIIIGKGKNPDPAEELRQPVGCLVIACHTYCSTRSKFKVLTEITVKLVILTLKVLNHATRIPA